MTSWCIPSITTPATRVSPVHTGTRVARTLLCGLASSEPATRPSHASTRTPQHLTENALIPTANLPFTTEGLSCADGRTIVERMDPAHPTQGFKCTWVNPPSYPTSVLQPGSHITCFRGSQQVKWDQAG